jgi:hypothetical protein
MPPKLTAAGCVERDHPAIRGAVIAFWRSDRAASVVRTEKAIASLGRRLWLFLADTSRLLTAHLVAAIGRVGATRAAPPGIGPWLLCTNSSHVVPVVSVARIVREQPYPVLE